MEARHPQGDNLPTVNVSPIERIASAAAGAICYMTQWLTEVSGD
jgi:hypothetical protein